MPSSCAYGFGPYTLRRDEPALYEGERQVPLGDKQIELLFALVENNHQVVSKAELLRRLWPHGAVDESTLRFHVSGLRKALGEQARGERYIANVNGRGYCFVAQVERFAPVDGTRPRVSPLPVPAPGLLGRDRALQDLQDMIARHRFVSVVGAGGMGKSSLAFALAQRLRHRYPDGIYALDVALIDDPAMVATTLAQQLGVVYAPGQAVEALCHWFRPRRALVLLDSCESQIEPCAALARTLLEQAAQLHVLATGREALQVKGEWVLQLRPLATPPQPWAALVPRQILAYPAVQLALERARARDPTFAFADADLPLVGELVTRLDGMPLAIELAAARLAKVPLRTLLDELETAVFVHGEPAQGALNRHRTLRDLLDWSYERLAGNERAALRRLSVCNGSFTLETAQAVGSDESLDGNAVVDAVIGLEAKSLLSVESRSPQLRFRLLDSTRAYAAQRLGRGDEYRQARLRQCAHLLDTMQRADNDLPRLSLQAWVQLYGPAHNDMRACIAWAFGADGDASRGVRLVAASIGYAHHLALAEEYAQYVARALSSLPSLAQPEPEVESALLGGQFVMHLLSRGPGSAMWTWHARVLDLAEQMDSDKHRVEALNGLFVQAYFGHGDYPAAAGYADAVAALASRSAETASLVQRLQLQALHGMGDHEAARRGLEAVLRDPPPRRRMHPPFPIDMAVMARMMLARIHWLQGRADDALALLGELQELATRDVRFALANAYAWSICPLYFWCGDLAGARASIEAMHARASDIEMPFTAAWACAYGEAWSHLTGRPLPLLPAGVSAEEARRKGVVSELLGTFHESLVSPELLERRRNGTLGWCAPEITRAEGAAIVRRQGAVEPARMLFVQALNAARAHGALAWELRAATSLADFHVRSGHGGHARAVLEPVLDRFTQGLATADYRAAQQLLQQTSA